MDTSLSILHLEDNLLDAELVQSTLEIADIACVIRLVDTGEMYDRAMRQGGFDLILSDYQLPSYDGLTALRLAREAAPHVPFIFVSGVMGEDAAIQALTQGATDYVLKQKLSRLAPAVKRAISEARNKLERAHAEAALTKAHDLLERIFSTTEFMVAYLDADFNFIRVNRAYAEADGRNPDFFVGKNHFALYPSAENEAIFRHAVETGEPYVAYARPFEYAGHPERGLSYWDWTLQPVKEADDRVSGLVFSLVNVTEREKAILAQRKSEERYRTLVEQASDGIFVADSQGNYMDVNSSGCEMLGYTREEILRLNMKDLISPDDQSKTPIRFTELRIGKVVLSERRMKAKSGALVPVEISGKMLSDGRLQGIVRDIRERKQHDLEREAIIAVANAIRTANTRAEILAIILDQLNELFNAEGAFVATRDAATGEIWLEMGRGPVGERFTGLRIPSGQDLSSWIIAHRTPYSNNNVLNDPLFYRPDLLGETHAVAAVPLIAQAQVIGALWVARRHILADIDTRLLTAIADLAANAIQRVTLYEQTERQLHRLIALHQIDITISASLDLNITLMVLLNNVVSHLDVDAASVLLLTPHTQMLEYAAGVGFRTRNIEQSRVRLGAGQAGRAALHQQIVSFPDLDQAQEGFGRSKLLAEEKFTSHYVAPLIAKGQIKGVLEVFTRQRLDATQDWVDFFETLATQAAIAIDSATLFNNLQRSNTELRLAYDATIEGWSRALDLRDKETEGHTQRVTEMALRLASKMGMSDMEKLDLRRGALLHDIGKMGIPDSILLKPGELTEAEWVIMRQHPTYAYEMLAPITYLKQALDIPYCHHEKWDGSGYPRGLKGEQIPLAARLFAVVDVWDALRSDRPYRPGWPEEKILSYIWAQAGAHFEPHAVELFMQMMRENAPAYGAMV